MPAYNPSRKQRMEELGKAGASERPRENSGPSSRAMRTQDWGRDSGMAKKSRQSNSFN